MNESFILCRPSQLEDFPTFQFFNGGCSRHANRARAPRSERTKGSAVSRVPICLATLLLHNDDVALRVAGVTEGCFQVGSERQLPTGWRVLRQSQMRSILVVVAHVFCHESLEMPLIEDNYVIQQVSSATPNPALSNPVLHGLRYAVRSGLLPICRAAESTSLPNFES